MFISNAQLLRQQLQHSQTIQVLQMTTLMRVTPCLIEPLKMAHGCGVILTALALDLI